MCVSPYCSRVQEIREIGRRRARELVDDRERRAAARVRRASTSFVDWRSQADEMVWLLARARRRAGRRRLRADRLAHAAAPRDRRWRSSRRTRRGAGVGAALVEALERWARRARRDRAGRRRSPEDDAGSLAWTAAPRLRGGRPQLAARARPDRDRRAGAATRRDGIEIVTWAERPELARRHVRGRARGDARHPGRGGGRHRHARGVARARHAGRERPTRRAVFVALAGDEVVGYAKLSLSPRAHGARLSTT